MHHITASGEDAGVVYCEMQGRENSAESRLYLQMNREMYPGKCGYKSETGGIMKNLRESTTNVKVCVIKKIQVATVADQGSVLTGSSLVPLNYQEYNHNFAN